MRRPFLKWAFNPRNNTVDIVIELIFILDWINKNPESRQEMEEMIGDALKESQSLVASAFNNGQAFVSTSYNSIPS